jgi:hypothetical protein
MMATSIPRQLSDPDGLDFDGIRRRGIDFLQSLSSAAWTDYNLHDPGVTLLEMLCYGLTDLVYRTDFDVADYLTGASGRIDFEQQALYPPDRIFPNQPVTDIDFCKLIYDHLPQVDDVWIASGTDGLFSVYIKPRTSLFHARDRSDDTLRLQVLALLARHRNLGRDVEQVQVVAAQPYMLAGEIEVDDSRPAADIYADLYFQCALMISSGGRIVRFEEARAAGMRWEDMFDGPLTTHGYIEDSHFAVPNYAIDAIALIALARRVPGVRQVGKLCLMTPEGEEITSISLAQSAGICPVLAFPDDANVAQRLRLVHGSAAGARTADPALADRYAARFYDEVRLYLKKREFEHDAFRTSHGNLPRLLDLPQGQYRPLDAYASVGEHTPAIYGINHFGVPKSAPPEDHARALQLKAYLYPFEQLMANYLGSLQGIKQLYAIDGTLDQTYFATFLDDGAVPKLQTLYREGVGKAEIDAVLREQDAFADRRNRVLDSLLAMYGEVFPDDALRRYDLYHADAFERHLIDCKIGLLRHLCDLSGRRGNGIDLQRDYGDGSNYAAIQHRVQLLAGTDQRALGRSLTAGLLPGAIDFLSDKRYCDKLGQAPVPFAQTGPLAASGPIDGPPLPLPHGAVSPALLRAGIHRANYRVLDAGDGHGWLCLNVTHQECWPIARLPSAELAAAGEEMRTTLVDLNRRSEGFHLLEHVLLRPRDGATVRSVPPDFYGHRVSVILPAFTARFADLGYRAWMEELIAQNLPAHILPQFYWLDFPLLAQFEQRQASWLALLRDDATGAAALDAAGGQLLDFLARSARYHTNRVWA